VHWTIALAALSALTGVLAGAKASAQQNSGVNPDQVLTEDVVVRILGMEMDELAVPPVKDDDAESKAAAVRKKEERQAIAEAIAAFHGGDGDAAVKKFKEAGNIDPDLPPANVLMARLCFVAGDQNVVALGRNFLERSADKDADRPEPYLMLAQLALVEGRLTEAYVLFEKAGKLIETDEVRWSEKKRKTLLKSAWGGRVSVCEQRQNWRQGLEEAATWLAIDAEDPVATFRNARLIFMQAPKIPASAVNARTEFERAYELAKAAVKGKDRTAAVPPAELALLELHSANGNSDAAREELQRIDAKSAEWEAEKREGSRVYSAVSQWYLGQGDFGEAQKYASRAIALDKDSEALEHLNAVLHYFARDPAAEAEFTQINQEKPDDFFSTNFLALILSEATLPNGGIDEAKRAKAVRMAEMNVRLNPRSPVALSTLGWAYFNSGRRTEAAQIFGALDQQPNLQVSADTAYYMARSFAALPPTQFPNAMSRARALLESAVRSTGAFRYRQNADQWLETLGGTAASRTKSSTSNSEPAADK
jgi:tetratricopeptide (TPR) repeat protein